jgi:hypothetical protein
MARGVRAERYKTNIGVKQGLGVTGKPRDLSRNKCS